MLLSGCDLAGCLSEIETHRGVGSLKIVNRDADCATVQLKTPEPAVLSAASRAGTPFVYPAVVDRGELIVTVVGTHAGVSMLADLLRADGLTNTVLPAISGVLLTPAVALLAFAYLCGGALLPGATLNSSQRPASAWSVASLTCRLR